MSTALLEAPLTLALRERRPTLAELLDATWRHATTNGSADCPICHGAMHAQPGGAGAARCDSCGTTLA
jgi:nitrate/TMAO reductase-like tetraheme cytochrome c subunit